MASSSRRQAIPPGRISEFLTNAESEDDDSDSEFVPHEVNNDSDSEESGESDSENEEDINQAPQPTGRPRSSNKRPRHATMDDSWVWMSGDFRPTLHEFDDSNSGINPAFEINDEMTEIDFFKLFFDAELVGNLVSETNKFYKYAFKNMLFKDHSRLHKWTDVSENEMYLFLGVFILMSHVKKMRLKDYWSTDNLIQTPIFGKLMSTDRFQIILRLLHFNDNENQVPGDRLYKIRPVIMKLKESFRNIFVPHKNLAIDESLVLWKGRLAFKQYIPSKRHRFGIKLFILCDSLTGYILDFIVYTGATTEQEEPQPGLGISGAVVLTLLRQYLDKGHCLYIDNWYTSPTLVEKLYEKKTGCCGTVKANRIGMPTFPSKMSRGDVLYKHTDKTLAVQWKDKREVRMLSSFHSPGMSPSGKINRTTNQPIEKPTCVIDYNKNMGAVDKSDMQISFVECTRKSIKWYKKFFFHLLDVTTLNAYILFKETKHLKLEFSDFRLELVRQIVESHHEPSKSPKGGRPSLFESPLRLTERHFPSLVPATEKKTNASRKCFVCANSSKRPQKRKESRYMCKDCDKGLCVTPCFEEYHTLKCF